MDTGRMIRHTDKESIVI
jgi:hypothetical protein